MIFENFGYYWAASDYFDSELTGTFYSKGGYLIRNYSRWVLKNIHNGSVIASFGKPRYNTNENYQQAWEFRLDHNHNFTPFLKLNSNLISLQQILTETLLQI